MTQIVLVVDDDPAQRRILEENIKRFGYRVLTAEGGAEAIDALDGTHGGEIALMVLDLVMPEVDGMAVLDKCRKTHPNLPVIVQTAHGGIDTVVNAMRAGADDFVVKPVGPERLQVSIRNALKVNVLAGELNRLSKKNDGTLSFEDLIAASPGMSQVARIGERAAQSNIPVLIEGESGVGKEMVARAIQGASDRSGKPFVTVNCGALPENLVESILFGHEKGAFTGASDKHVGKFQEADGGTLFLDEVGELPLDIQVKLLRALQEGEVDPVGAKRAVKVDIRLISATNRNMIDMVKEGQFREDLYYRLNVFPIMIPPLAERLEDVPHLVSHFLARFAIEEGKKIEGIGQDAMRLMQSYEWPGNVRQLENTIFRAVVLCDGYQLSVQDFPQIAAMVDGFEATVPPAPAPRPEPVMPQGPAIIGSGLPETTVQPSGTSNGTSLGIPALTSNGQIRPLDEVEADMIRLALERYRGHMSEVARKLGIGRSTLYRKVRELGLEDEPQSHGIVEN